ncbi:MAG: hypothetical protein H6Q18_57 [Bacteroidetes bacterium]|nr:hypothetical protein [Bacteroidota bacterium]
MTQVNGMPITDGLIKIIDSLYCYDRGEENYVDEYTQFLMDVNDYLLERLTEASPDDVDELKKISALLVNTKAVRDFSVRLSTALKEIAELRDPEKQ